VPVISSNNKVGRNCSIDEFNDTMVAKKKIACDVNNRRALARVVTSDRQKELMLGGGEASCTREGLTLTDKTPQTCA
jgi:hypothetical protein